MLQLQKTVENLVETLSSNTDNDNINACIDVHQKALDDLVNVNSLFTIAVFLGLAYANPNQRSLENRPECDPDPGLGKRLIIFEVNSFDCFLFSSLVAKAIEVLLNISKKELTRDCPDHLPDRLLERLQENSSLRAMEKIFFGVSGCCIVLLTLSIVYVIQIRVGKLTCGSDHAIQAVAPLCVILFTALLFYVPSMAYAVVVTASACQNHENMKMADV
ncbi:hypothetical protein Q3G72_025551 [Acer saccharum]|nr:hypothetical protein Q3G72_025551 [Acer saccharum]